MNIKSKNLNLLLLFRVIFEERNLSAAAQRLAMSQPAVSHALKRLRQDFNDPLFVRHARGMVPTPLALAVAPRINEILRCSEQLFEGLVAEDFSQVEGTFVIATTDIVEQSLMPLLLPKVQAKAPGLTLSCRGLQGQLPKAALEQGGADLAIAGFFGDLPGELHQQALFEDHFVVLASRSNRQLQKGLDLNTYVASRHLITSLKGDLKGLVDQALAAKGLRRHIAAAYASFLAPASALVGSDLLLTCLSQVARQAVLSQPDLQMLPCPLDLPRVQFQQVWHPRSHQDPLHRWLRQWVHQCSQALGTKG
ncbi:LysR family transcriptional regulator [Gallaecimonas xiamenensis]|uniref:LysR family transcriptional regulator n=1 Tax=Gallaecimonas xiamenensis 3-C-1 TaxID=745411 RepID=K2IH85_9GAMM|nr:LysR family transcriptional regulator [Gallaecimonas xiamenensis]EKE69476.1 LysR family transcriptional regulator [Gallaecimonas xiamenensis 3-C-1]